MQLTLFTVYGFNSDDEGGTSFVNNDMVITQPLFLHRSKMWRKLPLAVQCDKKKFTKFISSPLCSYSSRRHRSNGLKNYVTNLEVEGKIDVLMGLASASVKYRREDETSRKREVIYLSSSVYARKGFLVAYKETPKYTDRGIDFNVEGIEIGMEDILIVTAEYVR